MLPLLLGSDADDGGGRKDRYPEDVQARCEPSRQRGEGQPGDAEEGKETKARLC